MLVLIMRIISKKVLRDFWHKHERAKGPLEAWHAEAVKADWLTPVDIKARYKSADILKGNRVIFNIAGNHYRLVVQINYNYKIVFIRFIGTHKEYDQINAEEI